MSVFSMSLRLRRIGGKCVPNTGGGQLVGGLVIGEPDLLWPFDIDVCPFDGDWSLINASMSVNKIGPRCTTFCGNFPQVIFVSLVKKSHQSGISFLYWNATLTATQESGTASVWRPNNCATCTDLVKNSEVFMTILTFGWSPLAAIFWMIGMWLMTVPMSF